MPTLDWIGKGAVINHHREVPYHLLRCNGGLSAGNADAGNLLVQGDNLLALKALLPYYAGRVKCIYIDPPYNTGNEKWAYNDKVNSPTIRKWLDKVVGGETEDLCRHDKWLCMMYPRLYLLRRFLAEDGAIFISIDDNEIHRLRMMMDEIFGPKNSEIIIWRKSDDGRYGKMKNTKTVRNDHEYVVVGFKGDCLFSKIMALPQFANPPTKLDKKGKWWTGYIARGERGSNPKHSRYYTVTAPNGKEFSAQFEVEKTEFNRLDRAGYIHWSSTGIPYRKIYSHEPRPIVASSVFLDVGTSYQGRLDFEAVLGEQEEFPNPKPTNLIKRLVELATRKFKDAIILDSFAGSATTAQAVLELNKGDSGNRKFICVEMDDNICRNVAAQRIARVINGYKANGKGERVEGLGGGFRFCTLGAPLFNAEGKIGGEVKFSDLAAHIFFCETGSPIPKRAASPLIGVYNGEAIYLLFNGILGDKRVDGGNVLTSKTLVQLPPHSGHKIVYGEGCRISESRLRREKITFRQLPYDIQTT